MHQDAAMWLLFSYLIWLRGQMTNFDNLYNEALFRSGVARIWCEGGTGRGAEGAERVGSPSPGGERGCHPPQKNF